MCLSLYLFSCVEGELTDTYPGRVLCAQKSFEVDPNEPNVTGGSVQPNFGAVGIINWVKMTLWIFFCKQVCELVCEFIRVLQIKYLPFA